MPEGGRGPLFQDVGQSYANEDAARYGGIFAWRLAARRRELTAVVGGGRALRAAVLFAVRGGEVGLGRASAEAHLTAARGHLGHALLGLQSLRPAGTARGEKKCHSSKFGLSLYLV